MDLHDSRYSERMPVDVQWIPFAKPGKVDTMAKWDKIKHTAKTEKCKRWVHAVGRSNFSINNVNKHTYICSLHFIDPSGPTLLHPDPVKATASEKELESLKKCAKKRGLPKTRSTPVKKTRRQSLRAEEEEDVNPIMDLSGIVETEGMADNVVEDDDTLTYEDEEHLFHRSTATQTQYSKYELSAKIETIALRNELTLRKHVVPTPVKKDYGLFNFDVIVSANKCKFFTGLELPQFHALYNFLGDSKENMTYWGGKGGGNEIKQFSLKEQMMITLMRLRRGDMVAELSHKYKCSDGLINQIFITWIQLLFYHFKNYLTMPHRDDLHRPAVFKPFPQIRASIDCTEFRCQSSGNLAQQGNTYSNYKHHTTMKCLIAVTPHGAAAFVSDLFEGSIDDISMFKQCGIMDHIVAGDEFLVDRGFLIQHLLLEKGAKIFVPPFLDNGKLNKEATIKTSRIAKARIHVERFNERLKKFRLLDQVIPRNHDRIISQCAFVASALVNFQDFLCR